MDWLKNISRVFEASEEIPLDDSSKIILMSDCHRGDVLAGPRRLNEYFL